MTKNGTRFKAVIDHGTGGVRDLRVWREVGLALAAAMLLGLAGCAAAPVAEFRSYSDAAEQVNQTTLALLADYQAAIDFQPNAAKPDVPLVFDPSAFEGNADPAIQARKAAVAVLRDYSAKMLFLAEGGSYEAVQARIGSLVSLIGSAFPAAAGAGGVIGTLAGQLEKARSAREFRDALQAATVPPSSGDCTARRTAAKDALTTELGAATCLPILDGIYAVLKADTRAFYAAQHLVYVERVSALGKSFAAEVRTIQGATAQVKRPDSGPEHDRLVGLEKSLNDLGRSLNPAHLEEKLVTQIQGDALNAALLSAIELRINSLKSLAVQHTGLKAALVDYHTRLGAYVGLINQTGSYLDAVGEAAVRPVDNLERAERLVRLGLEIESGAVRSRAGFSAASSILLGLGGS